MAAPVPARPKADAAVLRDVRVGRGYGITVLKVMDVALVGATGKSYHVLGLDGRPVCRCRGDVRAVERGVDARAERVANAPVCVTCIDLLPPVPGPHLEREPLQ